MDLYTKLGEPLPSLPETPPSAAQSQDPGPPGLCNCPQPPGLPRVPTGCACALGELIQQLRLLAYRMPRDKALVELPHVQMQLVAKLADLRREALQRRAAEWTGTVNEFLKAFELTRSNLDRLEIKVRRPD